MTNGEKWKKELLEFADNEIGFGVWNGVPDICDKEEKCYTCEFFSLVCAPQRIKWLVSEYQEPRVLTKEERQFCESAETVYLTRDTQGDYKDSVEWWVGKPTRDKDGTFHQGSGFCLTNYYYSKLKNRFGLQFNSIKPGECVSVKELLKWDVEE